LLRKPSALEVRHPIVGDPHGDFITGCLYDMTRLVSTCACWPKDATAMILSATPSSGAYPGTHHIGGGRSGHKAWGLIHIYSLRLINISHVNIWVEAANCEVG